MASVNFKRIRNYALVLVLIPTTYLAISFVNAKSVIGNLEANLDHVNEVQAPAITYLGTMKAEVAKLDKWINRAVTARDAFKIYEADQHIRASIEKMDEALDEYSALPIDSESIEQAIALKQQWPELRQLALESLAAVEDNNSDVAAIMLEEKYEALNTKITLALENLANDRLQSVNNEALLIAERRL
jgi:hypothetical protein